MRALHRIVLTACLLAGSSFASSIILEGEVIRAPLDNPEGVDYYLISTSTDEIIAGLNDPFGDLIGLVGTVNRIWGTCTGASFGSNVGEEIPIVEVERCGVAAYAFPSGAQQGGYASFTGESSSPVNSDTSAILDHDGDGMLTSYEQNNDLDPTMDDSTGDLDNDHYINLYEFHAGTDANDNTSLLKMDGIQQQGDGTLTFRWQSVPNMQYRIVSRAPGDDTILESRIIPSAGANTSTAVQPSSKIRIINIEVQP